MKNFDTFSRISARKLKLNAVAHAQLTYQMLALYTYMYTHTHTHRPNLIMQSYIAFSVSALNAGYAIETNLFNR